MLLFWFRHRFFLPTDFVAVQRIAAVRCGTSVRFFLMHLRFFLAHLAANIERGENTAANDAAGYRSDDGGAKNIA